MRNKEPNSSRVEFYKKEMITSLKQFEEYFLKDSFINGENISYADIAAACEIEQPRMFCTILYTLISQ